MSVDVKTLRRAKEISDELEAIDEEIKYLVWATHRITREILVERKYFFRTTNGPDKLEIKISDEDIQLLINRRINRKKALIDEMERL